MVAMRVVLVRVLFGGGVVAVLGSTQPPASLAGVSDTRRVTLDAATPSLLVDATATATADVPLLGGEIGLTVTVDPDSAGSLLLGLRSVTSGAEQESDVLDPQAQGDVRIGIDAFAGCVPDEACGEDLVVELSRSDDELDGALTVEFQLDAFVDTDGAPTSGELVLTLQ